MQSLSFLAALIMGETGCCGSEWQRTDDCLFFSSFWSNYWGSVPLSLCVFLQRETRFLCVFWSVARMFDCDFCFTAGYAITAWTNLPVFCCLVCLFACVFVFPVWPIPSLTLCVFSLLSFLRARWSSFLFFLSSFQSPLLFLSLFPFLSFSPLSLSVMQAHSHLHPRSHPSPSPTFMRSFLSPSPAWLCAAATMPGARRWGHSPRESCRPDWTPTIPTAIPPQSTHLPQHTPRLWDGFTSTPMQHTHKQIICGKLIVARPLCVHADRDKHTPTCMSTSVHMLAIKHIHTHTELHRKLETFVLSSALCCVSTCPLLPLPPPVIPLHPSLRPALHAGL